MSPASESHAEIDARVLRAARGRLVRAALNHDVVVGSVIVVATLSHRLLLWWMYGNDIVLTIDRNQSWLTWQFMPVQAYHDHFLASIFYLQQTPPIPHLILGIIIKLFEWPFGVALSLLITQSILTVCGAVLLWVLLKKSGVNRWLSLFVALWFSLSSDLYLLEINEFGQLFYESGGMVLVTLSALLLCGGAHAGKVERRTLAAGVMVSLAALTRASLSFLAVPAVVVVMVRRGWRAAFLFLVPVMVLQGGWCLKNTIVYHHLTVATSSWSGLNAANGINVMNGGGSMDSRNSVPLASFILEHRDRYPDWLIRTVQKYGYVDWFTFGFPEFLSSSLTRMDAEIQERMGGTNPFTNSAAIAELSRVYARVTLDYMLAHPIGIWRKFSTASRIFWQPMADFSRLYMGPLYIIGPERDLLTGPYLRRDATAFARDGHQDVGAREQITLPAPSLYALDTLSLLSIYIMMPLLIMADLAKRMMRRAPLISGDLWVFIAIVIYGIAVSTLVDLGENMRFRLSFEPIIISVTMGVLVTFARTATTLLAGAKSRSGDWRRAFGL